MAYESSLPVTISQVDASPDLKESIRNALAPLGGIDSFVHSGDTISLKPNLNSADPYPASSDSAFIQALGEVFLEAGASKLRIVESAMISTSTRKVAMKTGLLDVAQALGADVEFLDEGNWIRTEIPRGTDLTEVHVGEELLKSEKLVLVPCLKTHKFARYTGAMKLMMGGIRPRDRLKMHARGLEVKIADLATLFSPHLIVMDARRVFVTGGPFNGQIEEPGVIIAGTNILAVDVVGVRLLQRYDAKNRLDMPVWELPQIRHGVEVGLGVSTNEDIRVVP
ncbi:MAG: DUF362 domain-containing protein [Candidatus Thorarchaeota archaeon]|nr:DUF362 domain-containing protein [Candidatus Thorarchaeota archaeon]